MQVDNLFLISNIIATLNILKKLIVKKYKMKDLKKVKTIISQQITKDIIAYIIKID